MAVSVTSGCDYVCGGADGEQVQVEYNDEGEIPIAAQGPVSITEDLQRTEP